MPVSLQPGKFYLARFHVNSNTPSYGNPALRLRAGVGNGLVDSELWLTSANANSVAENKIAAELLPGPGTKNIDVKGEERQGGYYNVYFTVPASVRADGVSNRLNIGYDLIDYGYDGQGSVEQLKEGGRYTLDSVEIREIPQP